MNRVDRHRLMNSMDMTIFLFEELVFWPHTKGDFNDILDTTLLHYSVAYRLIRFKKNKIDFGPHECPCLRVLCDFYFNANVQTDEGSLKRRFYTLHEM